MGSTRLPGKILRLLAGKPMLQHVIERSIRARKQDGVIIATTTSAEDDAVENLCLEKGFTYFRGSAENVLERYFKAAEKFGADVIIRVTSDCPLIDPEIIDLCVARFCQKECDYISNAVPGERTFPRGLDVEVFSFKALEYAYKNASENYEKEHVTPYIWENKKKEFKIGEIITASPEYARNYRLTVDYPEDFILMEKIYATFYQPGKIIAVPEVLKFLDWHQEIVRINAHCEQKPLHI